MLAAALLCVCLLAFERITGTRPPAGGGGISPCTLPGEGVTTRRREKVYADGLVTFYRCQVSGKLSITVRRPPPTQVGSGSASWHLAPTLHTVMYAWGWITVNIRCCALFQNEHRQEASVWAPVWSPVHPDMRILRTLGTLTLAPRNPDGSSAGAGRPRVGVWRDAEREFQQRKACMGLHSFQNAPEYKTLPSPTSRVGGVAMHGVIQ